MLARYHALDKRLEEGGWETDEESVAHACVHMRIRMHAHVHACTRKHAGTYVHGDMRMYACELRYEALHQRCESLKCWLDEHGPEDEEVEEEEKQGASPGGRRAGSRGLADARLEEPDAIQSPAGGARRNSTAATKVDIELLRFNRLLEAADREPIDQECWLEFKEWVHATAEITVENADSRVAQKQRDKHITSCLGSLLAYDVWLESEVGDEDEEDG